MSYVYGECIRIRGCNNPSDFSDTVDIPKIKLMDQTIYWKEKFLQTSLFVFIYTKTLLS